MSKSKREIFALEYAKDCNATQAAIRAGYSPRTAYSQGQRLLKKDEVKEKLTAKMKNLEEERGRIQDFWARVMTDENQDMKTRLTASELLAKSLAVFAVFDYKWLESLKPFKM